MCWREKAKSALKRENIANMLQHLNVVKSMQHNLKYLKEERGAIFVLTALLLPIMFGCLGIAYDVGNIYIHKARLQNVADAAALAGGRAYLESQKKTTNQDTYDSPNDDNGRTAVVYKYTLGGEKNGRDGKDYVNNRNHADADKAADDYIYKNIYNLGKTVYADKFSHYALKGLTKNPVAEGEESANPTYNSTDATEIFYRIGLYETVPLYFLPVITNKNQETVRAGSVVVVVPGGTTSTEDGLTINTDNYKTIFDNLITYSYKLEMRHTTQYDVGSDTYTVNASFDGDIVYTHMNNTTDDGEPQSDKFYQHTVNDGDQEDSQYTHLVYNTSTIDDPVINTFTNTQAYLSAFRKKLTEAHVDFHDSQKKLYLTGDGNIDVQCLEPNYQLNGEGTYRKDGDVYYLLDSDGNDVTFDENGKTYKICYYKLSERYVRCGKCDDDLNYYLLNKNGNITNCYIEVKLLDQWNKSITPIVKINETTKYLGLSWDAVPKFMYGDNQYYTPNLLTIDDLNPHVELPLAVTSDKFTEKPLPDFGAGTSNVYHVTPKLLPDPNGFELHIDTDMAYNEETDEPLYVIVDEGIADWKIYSTTSSDTKRPIIIVYLGNSRIDCYFTGQKFVGTIYAPNSYVEINTMCPRFEGNFIIKNMYFQPAASTQSSWKAVNHLTKDTDVTEITRNFQEQLDAAETAMNNLLKDTASNSDLIDRLVSGLGINKSDLGNMDYYMNLTLAQKKQLYVKWKKMYDEADDAEKNLLWPFNGLFTMTNSSSEGGSSETTQETLRLINYRTENRKDDSVVDPFIFKSLGTYDEVKAY